MNDGVDRAERSARCANKFGCRPGAGKVAGTPLDTGAGTLTLRAHRFQSLKSRSVRALPVQHQALIPGCQPARDRGADPGSTPGDD